jgi:ATP-dependent Clp protease ATP-binding subunit ClpX
VSLQDLDREQLISILTQVNGNMISQYQWLFDKDNVKLEFDADSLDLIVDRTLTTRTGARGLHSELERILLPHMFDLPTYRAMDILRITISKNLVNTPTTLLLQENT